jgi:hypothetical protein
MHLYWITIFVSGLLCTVLYTIALKYDCAIISLLIAAAAFLAQKQMKIIKNAREETRLRSLTQYHELFRSTDKANSVDTLTPVTSQNPNYPDADEESRPHPHMKFVRQGFRFVSIPFRLLHAIVCVLNVIGAISLALQERYDNPGTPISVSIPGYSQRVVNYYCNAMSVIDPDSKPTIWFETSASHGIVDFLGVQHYLALKHNFSSCSYDPPNFGWSSRLPAKLKDHNLYLPALVEALGKQNENRVYVGWNGGLNLAIEHASNDPEHTTAVIDLDDVPIEIEYLDKQRQSGWNNSQSMNYRSNDLRSKIKRLSTILTLGYAW